MVLAELVFSEAQLPIGEKDRDWRNNATNGLHHVDDMFHEEYNRNSVSPATEFRRGIVTEWKRLLCLIYGERNAEPIVLGSSKLAKLSIPPAGPLTEDGKGYYGFDSMCHTFIGPVQE
jgi:hypothetical protein